jgi:hypothetical protein
MSVGLLMAASSSVAGCTPRVPEGSAGRPSGPIHAAPTCLGPDDDSAYFSEVIAGVVSDTDSVAVRLRSGLELPQITPGQVTLITDSRTCAKAAAAMDANQGVTDSARQMYVFELGNTRFAVIEVTPPPPPGVISFEPTFVTYFDSKWKALSLSDV